MSSDPDPSDIAQLWKDAIEAYEKETKSDLECDLDSDDVPECTDVESVINVLQEIMEVFKKFRSSDSKWGKVRGVLERVVSVVLALNDVAGDAAAASGTPGGSVIFVGIGKLLSATKGVSDTYDSLQELFSQLSDYLLRLSTRLEVKTGLSSVARKNALDVLVHLLHVLALATKLLKKNRFAHWVQVVSGNKDMKDALAKLDKLTNIETRTTITETFAASQQILDEVRTLRAGGQVQSEALERIESKVSDVNTHLSVLVSDQTRQLDADIRQWLSPPDQSENQHRIAHSRLPGTGAWIFDNPTFVAWKDGEASTLWLHGLTGSGKSVLGSSIVDKLTDSPSTVVAYYYFDFGDTIKQTAHGLLCSLADQLSGASDDCAQRHRSFYKRHHKEGRPSLSRLVAHIHGLVVALSVPVYIVIDAVDECPLDIRRREVLPCLQDLSRLGHSNSHILMTSRPETDIRNSFLEYCAYVINLEEMKPHIQDLDSYVDCILHSDPGFHDWPSHLTRRTGDILTNKANGSFRWVSLQIDSLRGCLPKAVEKTLNSLPESLSDTYQRILDSIEKKYIDDVLRILGCMAFSERIMTPNELAEIFAIEFNHDSGIPKLVPEYRVSAPASKILELCSGLVAVSASHVSFAHFSVKEYLLSPQTLSRYQLNANVCRQILTQTCMACLHSTEFASWPKSICPLASYSTQYWMLYVSFPEIKECLNQSFNELLAPESNSFYALSRYYSHQGWCFESWPRWIANTLFQHPLICAAFFGLSAQIKLLSDNIPKPSADCIYKALTMACCSGQADAVAIILDELMQDLDINEPLPMFVDEHYRSLTLMQQACDPSWYVKMTKYQTAISQRSILHLLLDHGAKIDSPCYEDTESPLKHLLVRWVDFPRYYRNDVLAEQNAEPTLRLFLEYGADPNTSLKSGDSILHSLVRLRAQDYVSILLESGANVNQRNSRTQETALHSAAGYSEDSPMIQLLLHHGADVDARNSNGQTALYIGCWNRRPNNMLLLLENRADVYIGNRVADSLLYCAAFTRVISRVTFLDDALFMMAVGLGAMKSAQIDSEHPVLEYVCDFMYILRDKGIESTLKEHRADIVYQGRLALSLAASSIDLIPDRRDRPFDCLLPALLRAGKDACVVVKASECTTHSLPKYLMRVLERWTPVKASNSDLWHAEQISLEQQAQDTEAL